jgi:Zn-dependent protease
LNFDLADIARRLTLTLVPMILSLSVHEYAHAFTAYKLGDTTAKDDGRLTLNPQSHIDPWGTLLIPAISVLMGGLGFIGWARPTPFRAERFKKGVPRRLGAALVSAAGPLSNLAIALIAASGLYALKRSQVDPDPLFSKAPLSLLLNATFQLNAGLAIFNLLPFPPLDGARLLPPFLDPIVRPLERYGFGVLMLIFLFVPAVANVIFGVPLRIVKGAIAGWFGLA